MANGEVSQHNGEEQDRLTEFRQQISEYLSMRFCLIPDKYCVNTLLDLEKIDWDSIDASYYGSTVPTPTNKRDGNSAADHNMDAPMPKNTVSTMPPAVANLFRDFFPIMENTTNPTRILLCGPSGSGKSVYLTNAFHYFVGNMPNALDIPDDNVSIDDEENSVLQGILAREAFIPFPVISLSHFANLCNRATEPSKDPLHQWVSEMIEADSSGETANRELMLEALQRHSGLLLFFDGVDEMNVDAQKRFFAWLQQFLEREPWHGIVMTARTARLGPAALNVLQQFHFNPLHILPLNSERTIHMVNHVLNLQSRTLRDSHLAKWTDPAKKAMCDLILSDRCAMFHGSPLMMENLILFFAVEVGNRHIDPTDLKALHALSIPDSLKAIYDLVIPRIVRPTRVFDDFLPAGFDSDSDTGAAFGPTLLRCCERIAFFMVRNNVVLIRCSKIHKVVESCCDDHLVALIIIQAIEEGDIPIFTVLGKYAPRSEGKRETTMHFRHGSISSYLAGAVLSRKITDAVRYDLYAGLVFERLWLSPINMDKYDEDDDSDDTRDDEDVFNVSQVVPDTESNVSVPNATETRESVYASAEWIDTTVLALSMLSENVLRTVASVLAKDGLKLREGDEVWVTRQCMPFNPQRLNYPAKIIAIDDKTVTLCWTVSKDLIAPNITRTTWWTLLRATCPVLSEKTGAIKKIVRNRTAGVLLLKSCRIGGTRFPALLLEHNAHVALCNRKFQTPLHFATACENIPICRLLLENSAEIGIDVADVQMRFPACSAMITANVTLLRAVFRAIPVEFPHSSPLHRACAEEIVEGDLTCANYQALQHLLLDMSGSVNARTTCDAQLTPLAVAVERRNLPAVSLLVASRADVNAIYNRTSGVGLQSCIIFYPIVTMDMSMVRLLLQLSADPCVRDDVGNGPLHLACVNPMGLECVRLLLEYHADPMVAPNIYSSTLSLSKWLSFGIPRPLHVATCYGFQSIMELLVTRRASVNTGYTLGISPMHTAGFCGQKTTWKVILSPSWSM
eukprot:GEMP01005074.1.p1 GENE.GEMP01005074.1~~GEMP01005074.1.p1  ORF type:complete len:1020 (+),score=225.32 GEMP01005074.1:115-3174(+)